MFESSQQRKYIVAENVFKNNNSSDERKWGNAEKRNKFSRSGKKGKKLVSLQNGQYTYF